MFQLDLQSRVPIYEQLKGRISELVLVGQLKPGDQLPSVRNFARELGINPNTVQKAYQDLEREKIIYSVTGRGSYVSPDIDVGAQLQDRQLRQVRQAAVQAKACAIPEHRVVEAVKKVYREEGANDPGN